jgi:hypothetical protein
MNKIDFCSTSFKKKNTFESIIKSQEVKMTKKRKIASALALTFLALTAGLLPLPLANAATINSDQISAYAGQLTPLSDLKVPPNIDIIEELNKMYSETDEDILISKMSVDEALQKGDYDSYIAAIENLDGFPDGVQVIDENEFAILVQLKKARSDNE